VRIAAASEPACGSVSAKAPMNAPAAAGRSTRSCCSGLPWRCRIALKGALCTLITVETAPSPAATSISASA
jgi:hypothetical protein